ncbi:dual specificity protein phosphatase-like protein [Litoreibacter halocynthiae]|uniref:Dual specificity protein phosphatase-like protein n=1 Tax=Litoreibacter halocynthiae TaxID=1242689 RepID=A0A4R7LIZ5_9RHOB|nr:dual specificity protein phosphatase [Litoreibacter halocynthiae]TDT74020.1 dual specificity protein phosphatase-like protein [Litoreibacter halocynthiae]
MGTAHYDRPAISLIEEKVTPFDVALYIGGREGTADLPLLKKHGISIVVNCAVNLDLNYVPTEEPSRIDAPVPYGHGALRYYKIGLVDGSGSPASMMLAGYYILRGALVQELPDRPSYPHRERGNILVNCRGGRSRSTALVSLFLQKSMPNTYPTMEAALAHVRERRKLRRDEWHETPKQVLVDAIKQASDWIDMIGHDDVPRYDGKGTE